MNDIGFIGASIINFLSCCLYYKRPKKIILPKAMIDIYLILTKESFGKEGIFFTDVPIEEGKNVEVIYE